ncbi:MAG: 50S ribosomal protein L24 [Pseudomonadota bacterium]
MRKIRKNDEVVILAGKDKGKRGSVVSVVTNKDRVIVSGINMIKKHTKANPQANQPGGIIEKEAPLHVSNVAIWNAETQKADRVGVREEDGKKVRFFKSDNRAIDA